MSDQAADRAVTEYLARLDDLARRLPDAPRAELVGAITEHIGDARARGGPLDEAATRTMLDRLGDPAEIVAAAAAEQPGTDAETARAASAAGAHGRGSGTGLEIAAVVLLTAGSLVPLLGWMVGIVLVWCSRRWRLSEKLLATLVFPGGAGLAVQVGLFGLWGDATVTCTSESTSATVGTVTPPEVCTGAGAGLPTAVPVVAFAVAVLAPLVVAGVLLHRARTRAARSAGAPDVLAGPLAA